MEASAIGAAISATKAFAVTLDQPAARASVVRRRLQCRAASSKKRAISAAETKKPKLAQWG
jgi:hypothetical protein